MGFWGGWWPGRLGRQGVGIHEFHAPIGENRRGWQQHCVRGAYTGLDQVHSHTHMKLDNRGHKSIYLLGMLSLSLSLSLGRGSECPIRVVPSNGVFVYVCAPMKDNLYERDGMPGCGIFSIIRMVPAWHSLSQFQSAFFASWPPLSITLQPSKKQQ